MAGKPIGGPESAEVFEQSGQPPGGSAEQDAASPFCGPLAVRRIEKDDGRALIVYSRRTAGAEQ